MEGAVALLAAATGEARVLAGGTDLLVQMRADIVDPELIVDIKKITETRAVTEEKGGWRIGAAVTGAENQGARGSSARVAGRGRGREPHRLHAGPGSRDARRQPLQRLAGRRQRAGPHRRRGAGHPGRAAGPARPAGRGRHARPTQARAPEGRDRRVVPVAAPTAALGDAYLRFIPRTEMDIAVVGAGVSVTLDGGGRSPPPACRWARWRRGCCWCPRRPRPSSEAASTRPRSNGSRRRRGRRAARSTTSGERSSSASTWRPCSRAGRP